MRELNIEVPDEVTKTLSALNTLRYLCWSERDLKSTKGYRTLETLVISLGLTLDYDKDIEKFVVKEKPTAKMMVEGIVIESHIGTWYVIDTTLYKGRQVYLLEHEEHGDEAACLIVNRELTVLCENVWNGFDDLEHLEEKGAG